VFLVFFSVLIFQCFPSGGGVFLVFWSGRVLAEVFFFWGYPGPGGGPVFSSAQPVPARPRLAPQQIPHSPTELKPAEFSPIPPSLVLPPGPFPGTPAPNCSAEFLPKPNLMASSRGSGRVRVPRLGLGPGSPRGGLWGPWRPPGPQARWFAFVGPSGEIREG
jgi:hypothetical protein